MALAIPIKQDRSPVVALAKGRKISEVIVALEAGGANAVIDEDFARDVEEGIQARREPWNPPSWA